MKIKYDEKKWDMIAITDNFIAFTSKKRIWCLSKKEIFDLCEELLKHKYIPDFSQLQYNDVIFRKG